MSSVEQNAIDSLSADLSESLGLQGDNEESVTDPPLHVPIENQSETEPQQNNNSHISTMDSHENQLPSSSSSSENISSIDGCAISRPLRNSPESFGSSFDGESIGGNGATGGGDIESIDSPLGHFKTDIFDAEYRMDYPRRGKCLIFNHKHFVSVATRNGTDIDAYILEKCFASLGFEVETHQDLKFAELQDVLKRVSGEVDHSDADCFVCCILTHGEEEKLHASDHQYSKRDVYELFTGDKCPSLKGKPKVFLIQACRGNAEDPGTHLDCQTDAAITIAQPADRTQSIPIWADFLISYSTVEGYFSYRNTSSGGWFVQSLGPLLSTHGAYYDFVSILTHVNMVVARDFEARPKGKQIPQTVHTLTKKLVFRRKKNQPIKPSTISFQGNLNC
ncbi:caspase-3-like isoform X2 [Panonychus citri]|uniref:caspase-3-like isoform X2 n=1 Tax=Panonychus citri TaxID=50023 RepID=UPI002307C853|nr:caspase-3-like isoform X2 [Panonychus citri]XP_053200719.1 caspase-3-like isoform X2 [Panonychus citri]XP_053204424.1 caspase-3-like isoform X2 [Panonychus citri]XP_053204425.1 caspase-3-like isoform X2 [Panonychus citri]XP_053214374.1 caspase-3-like isoform X2 [Panonychus citri]XP_053214375.1 caspase-3-like isoform X2 [Panonychus citri]